MTNIFNEAEALARLGDNQDLLLKISAYFVVYSQRQIDSLRDAYIADDRERLRFLTHKMLGSIANFGANEAYEAGNRLQALLDERARKELLPDAYHQFIHAVERLQGELAEYSDGIEPPEINS